MTAGVEPLDQRRVSVVCRSTRVDVSLPAHLELVAIIPEIVDLVREHIRAVAGPGRPVDPDDLMGGATGGSWQLSRLAGAALSVSETLAQQRVHDGEILVLDHRPVPTPAPLFDDVVHGLTETSITGDTGWAPRWSRLTALLTVAVCALSCAGAVLIQWFDSGGPLPALACGALAVASLVAVVAARTSAVPVAALSTATGCAVWFTASTALTAVPGAPGAGHLLAGATTAAAVAVVLRVVLGTGRDGLGAGGVVDETGFRFDALCLASTLAAAVAAVAALVVSLTGAEPAAVAAGAVVIGVLLLTAAPRLAVAAGRVPLPPVADVGTTTVSPDLGDGPESTDATELAALPTPQVLRVRAASTRSWLTGLLAGSGAVIVVGSLVSLTGPAPVTVWSAPLAVVLVPVLVSRALAYADRAHVGVLLGWALVLVAGILVGSVVTVDRPVGLVVPVSIAVASCAVTIAATAGRAEPSPLTQRTIGAIEAVLITSVVPLALGAAGVYALIRHR